MLKARDPSQIPPVMQTLRKIDLMSMVEHYRWLAVMGQMIAPYAMTVLLVVDGDTCQSHCFLLQYPSYQMTSTPSTKNGETSLMIAPHVTTVLLVVVDGDTCQSHWALLQYPCYHTTSNQPTTN